MSEKNSEIFLNKIINDNNFELSKAQKLSLIKSEGVNFNNLKAEFKYSIFQQKYESFIKLFADIIYLVEKTGEITETNIINTNIQKENSINNISYLFPKETISQILIDIKNTLINKTSFSVNYQLNNQTFEGIIAPLNNHQTILYAINTSSEINTNLSNSIDEQVAQLIKDKNDLEKVTQYLFSRNKDLMASIEYAKKIQRAIFPEPKNFKLIFKDAFILFNPKDIVSGDLYWFDEYEDTTVLAVVDCTGHGVPGAFIAILAYSLLNKILSEKNVKFKQPSELLSELHFELNHILNYSTNSLEVKDGMDISLCLINKDHNLIYFSGAFQSLYLVQNGKLKIIKGDKLSVGGSHYGKKDIFRFTTTSIHYSENDAFYLTTDGYLDQFGGEKNKKFLNRRFRNMIENNYFLPMDEQKNIFRTQFDEWKCDNEQVDDILVVGFKCKFD